MSAKWRRNKRSSKFNIFRVFNKVKEKNASQNFRVKGSKTKRQARPYRRRVKFSGDKLREPEPLVDVVEENDEVAVVVEFSRFDRENMKIHVKDQRLTLSAEALDRKYHKSLNLPKRVIPNTMRTTYKNGVLEIRLKKAAEEKAIDKLAG